MKSPKLIEKEVMTPRDFAYWLQVEYEYGGSGLTGPLTGHQQRVLTAHIEVSKATKGDFNTDLVSFRTWVETAIEFDASHEKIQAKLHDLFEHVIDPMTTDPEKDVAQSASYGMFGYEPGARCVMLGIVEASPTPRNLGQGLRDLLLTHFADTLKGKPIKESDADLIHFWVQESIDEHNGMSDNA